MLNIAWLYEHGQLKVRKNDFTVPASSSVATAISVPTGKQIVILSAYAGVDSTYNLTNIYYRLYATSYRLINSSGASTGFLSDNTPVIISGAELVAIHINTSAGGSLNGSVRIIYVLLPNVMIEQV